MEQVASSTAPEGFPERKAKVILEIRAKISKDTKFEAHFRTFMAVNPNTMKSLLDNQSALMLEVVKRLEIDHSFLTKLEEFLELENFAELSDKWQVDRKIEIERGVTSSRVRQMANEKVEPTEREKREFLKNLLDCGYTLQSSEQSRKEEAIRESLQKKGLLARLWRSKPSPDGPPARITPSQMFQYFSQVFGNKMKKSPLNFQDIRIQANRKRIPCEPFKASEEKNPTERGYLLTKDDFCLVIDLDRLSIEFEHRTV